MVKEVGTNLGGSSAKLCQAKTIKGIGAGFRYLSEQIIPMFREGATCSAY
jgi:hypothetical protein